MENSHVNHQLSRFTMNVVLPRRRLVLIHPPVNSSNLNSVALLVAHSYSGSRAAVAQSVSTIKEPLISSLYPEFQCAPVRERLTLYSSSIFFDSCISHARHSFVDRFRITSLLPIEASKSAVRVVPVVGEFHALVDHPHPTTEVSPPLEIHKESSISVAVPCRHAFQLVHLHAVLALTACVRHVVEDHAELDVLVVLEPAVLCLMNGLL